MNSKTNFVFEILQTYCKLNTLSTLRMLSIMPIINDSTTLEETLIPRVLKSKCRKLWCLSACKKSTSFLRYCKDKQTCFFGNFGNAYCQAYGIWTHSINLQEIFMPNCMQKANFITHFFLKILQKKANLLFWLIWTCLTTHT